MEMKLTREKRPDRVVVSFDYNGQPVSLEFYTVPEGFAEFIVRACNSHEALIYALENITDCAGLVIERWEFGDLADAVRSLAVDLDNARAALKLAKGEE